MIANLDKEIDDLTKKITGSASSVNTGILVDETTDSKTALDKLNKNENK